MVEWRDIASAPKDGVVLLASMTVRDAGKGPEWSIVAGYWDAEFEYDNDEYRGAWTDDSVASWGYEERTELHPTHWMPLPSAPGTPAPDGTGSGEGHLYPNEQHLVDLLKREAEYSGVWFSHSLISAANLIERLSVMRELSTPKRDEEQAGEGGALRVGWWNDMRQRGVSQDIAIQKINAALAAVHKEQS